MDIILSILAFVLIVVGLVGCVLPIIPGQILAYCGYLCYFFCSYSDVSIVSLIIFLVLTIIVTIIDFILPSYFAKVFGGSKYGSIGAFIGLIVGMIVGSVIGALLGPFIGAALGEFINDRSDIKKALKVGFGSFMSFLLGTGIKLVLCIIMLIPVFTDIVSLMFNRSEEVNEPLIESVEIVEGNDSIEQAEGQDQSIGEGIYDWFYQQL